MTISRRDTLRLAAATVATGGATFAVSPQDGPAMHSPLSGVPSAALHEAGAVSDDAPDGFGDYELTIFLDFDFQDYTGRRTGARTKTTYGRYVVEAGRENGAWRMRIHQVLAEDPKHGKDVTGPDLMDVRDQTEGPDPLALLQRLLGGGAVLDGTQVIRDLRPREVDALHAASPDLQAELVARMSRGHDDANGSWFGRWALTASREAIDGFRTTDPDSMALAARVRAEGLHGKAIAAYAARMQDRVDALSLLADN